MMAVTEGLMVLTIAEVVIVEAFIVVRALQTEVGV